MKDALTNYRSFLYTILLPSLDTLIRLRVRNSQELPVIHISFSAMRQIYYYTSKIFWVSEPRQRQKPPIAECMAMTYLTESMIIGQQRSRITIERASSHLIKERETVKRFLLREREYREEMLSRTVIRHVRYIHGQVFKGVYKHEMYAIDVEMHVYHEC